MAAERLIEIRGLVVGFGPETVLEGLDLDLGAGEVLGVVGASGSGKSVLLRTIIGLIEPRAGTIRVMGEPVFPRGGADEAAMRRRWGVLFQGGALFNGLSVAQNVETPLREHTALARGAIRELARLKLALVGLDAAAEKYPAELSGGMRKRAGLARALALDPDILFLDEPTSGLDPISADAFDALLLDLHRALGFSVFMVTHDIHSLSATCGRIAAIAEKRIIVTGGMETMLDHAHPWVRAYFHGARARAAMGRREA